MLDSNPWETGNATKAAGNHVPANTRNILSNATDIDLKRLLALWPWVLLSLLVCFIAAKVYLRYAVPVYNATIQVSMKGDDQSINIGTSSIFDTRNPLNDKIDLLKAPTTLRFVVDSLNLEYDAVLQGNIKDKDLYKKLKWRILNEGSDLPYSITIKQEEDKSGFNWEKDGKSGTAQWAVPFVVGKDTLLMNMTGSLDAHDVVICTRDDSWSKAFEISSRITATAGDMNNTVILSYEDILKERAEDILTTLITAYNQLTIDYKSKSLVQSLRFMQQRIEPLNMELDSIETALAGFKSSRNLVGDGSAVAGLYLEKTSQLDAQANATKLQRQIFQSIENYVNNPRLKEENLSLVGLNDPYLQGLVTQFQGLLAEKEKLSLTVTTENPKYQVVEQNLQQVRSNITKQLQNYRNMLNMQEANVNAQLGQAKMLVKNTPATEKLLLEKQRQQNIKQSLFLLLLQKKEEVSIALSSTTSDVLLLAPARSYKPVRPKHLMIYGMALGIGLLLPLAFGLGRELLNNKITSKPQLEKMLSAPVIASVDLAVDEEERLAIVSKDDRSVTAEQIRALRSALRFYAAKGKPLVVLATSSYSGEGKTFVSGNLAKSYALQGLKVALLEFDMRKPKLARRMGIHNKQGLSTVLTGHSNPEDVFVPDLEAPNLHLYPTGAVPPNPSELIAMPGMDMLKQHLLSNYDVIIIDTPPFGLVADAQMLSEWVDVSLVVVRFNVTPREQVREIENWNQQHKLGKMAVVLNGVKTEGYYGYHYTPYYYRRKYGYEYYSNGESKKRKKKKINGMKYPGMNKLPDLIGNMIEEMKVKGQEQNWTEIIEPKSSLWKLNLRELWDYRDLLRMWVKRDFAATYKQTALGPLWFFIQPLLTTLMFVIVFGRFAKLSTDGLPQILFYLSGITIWNYFSESLTRTATVFKDNANIFGKVYFPRLVIPVSVVISNLAKFAIQFLLFGALLAYYWAKGVVTPGWQVVLLPVLLLLMAGFALGAGMLISAMTTRYRDLIFLLTFGVQLFMYATPVIYPLSSLDEKYRSIAALNPLAPVVETFRYAFLGSGTFTVASLVYSTVCMLVLLSAGVLVFNKVEKTFMDTV